MRKIVEILAIILCMIAFFLCLTLIVIYDLSFTSNLGIWLGAGGGLLAALIVAGEMQLRKNKRDARKILANVIKRGYIRDLEMYEMYRQILSSQSKYDSEARELLAQLSKLEAEGKLPVKP